MDEDRGTQVPGSPSFGRETEVICQDCGHPKAKHEGSPEDEFIASHGGVGYALCDEVDPTGETTDPCGCRIVMGGLHTARRTPYAG